MISLIINDSFSTLFFAFDAGTVVLLLAIYGISSDWQAEDPTSPSPQSLRFDLVRGWVLSYFPVELRSSLFSIPVPYHEHSFNSSYPLLRLYSIITIPTAPCSSRLTQELQYNLQQHVGASCLFAYTPSLIFFLAYESSLWVRRISHLLLRPTCRGFILWQSRASSSPRSLRFDLVRGCVSFRLSQYFPIALRSSLSPTCFFSGTLIQRL